MITIDSTTSDVLHLVEKERIKQESKWGPQNHSPADWIMILGEEFGEACKAALEARFAGPYYKGDAKTKLIEYRKELIQVAAVAVAMIECVDRNELRDI